MVELLDKVIGLVCKEVTFEEYLTTVLDSDKEIKYAETARKFILETKSNLHRIKHYSDYKNIENVKTLLIVTERLLLLILDVR